MYNDKCEYVLDAMFNETTGKLNRYNYLCFGKESNMNYACYIPDDSALFEDPPLTLEE